MIYEDVEKTKVDYEVLNSTIENDERPDLRILIVNPHAQEISENGIKMLEELLVDNKTVQLLCISDNKKLSTSVSYSISHANSHIYFSPIEGFKICNITLSILLDTVKGAIDDFPDLTEFLGVYKLAYSKSTVYTPPRDKVRLLSLTKDIIN